MKSHSKEDETNWNGSYDEAYNKIPLFSEPYKIRAIGMFSTYSMSQSRYSIFLKSHGQTYWLNVYNDIEAVSLTTINLKKYLSFIDDNARIFSLHGKLFNPRSVDGVIINDILHYDDSCRQYNISKELELEYLFGEKLTKKEFVHELFDRKEIEEIAPELLNDRPVTININSKTENVENESKMSIEDIIKGMQTRIYKQFHSSYPYKSGDLDEKLTDIFMHDDLKTRKTLIIDDNENDPCEKDDDTMFNNDHNWDDWDER